MKLLRLVTTAICCLSSTLAFSIDSPLTSIEFHSVFADDERVVEASKSGKLTSALLALLADPSEKIDTKAALINALGEWQEGQEMRAPVYYRYLTSLGRDTASPSAHDAFVLGYLSSMDEVETPLFGLSYLNEAAHLSKSETIAVIEGLVQAQVHLILNDPCSSYKKVDGVRNNETLAKDFRTQASQKIYDYMDTYSDSCN